MARPTKWKNEFITIAEAACKLGATDEDLADVLGVTMRTVRLWRVQKPEFAAALRQGKDVADDRVERSLYQRAVGYTFDSVHFSNYQGEVTATPYREHVPPDVTAQIFWLKNRKPDEWRERKELQIDVSFSRMTDEELQGKIEEDAQALGLPETAIEALLLTYEPEEKDGEGEK